jgi:hypothetical protein
VTAAFHDIPFPIAGRSAVVGIIAAGGLLAVYLGLITFAQGLDHAITQLRADLGYVVLIATGFGVQLALFAELRTLGRRHRSAAAVTAVGTGTSAAAMLACCAHHLADLLPLLGLSAAAVFLESYRTPLFFIGIGTNALGILVVARQLRRARRACAVIGDARAGEAAAA